jgi:hypothetical protein
MIERHELHCHNCNRYVQFNLDLSRDGNYKLECPNCGHEHYRAVYNGKITDIRWGQDPNQQSHYNISSTASTSTNSMYNISTSSSTFLTTSWLNTTTA